MMKRILAVAIILLTLLPLSDIGDAAALHAQRFAYENGSYWIPDITVTGNDPSKVMCDCCHETFDDEEAFARHLKYNAVCASYYYSDNNESDDNDKGDEPLDGYCCFCRLPISLCTCVGVDVPGYKKDNTATGGSGVFNVGSVSASGGGGSSSKNPSHADNRNVQEERKKNSLNRIKKFVSPILKLLLEKMDKAGDIVLVDDTELARYDPKTKRIYFGTNVEFEGLMHEVIHLAQDENGMLSYENNSSNNEFQTYLLNQICMKVNGEADTNVPTLKGLDSYDTFLDRIESNVGIDRDGLWYNQVLTDILNEYGHNWGEVFYHNTSALGYSGSNTHSFDKNYNYKWQAILEYLGFRQK